MSLQQPLDSTDFLPQVDAPILDDSIHASLLTQIHAERPSTHTTRLHRLVNTSYTPAYPPSLQQQHDTLAAGNSPQRSTTQGIDLTRYEQDALEPPNRTFPDSDEARPELLQQWRDTLRRAYASSTYLTGRNTSLALLETYGRNAWLVGNWQLESEIAALDAELAEARREAGVLVDERRARMDGAAAEMGILEERWKKGIGGLVEVQIATEQLRREILEKKSEHARR